MRKLDRDGVGLAYEEAGSGAPPIVLVHDFAADHSCFSSQFTCFSRRHRVVAVDLRGHGESDGPREACSVSVLADDLAWLCYELGLYRPVLLGHGLGGMVALDLAARYPDLPAGVVAVAPPADRQDLPAAVTPLALPRPGAAPLLENISNWDHIAAIVDEFISELADRAPP
jgi:pimeloyl-ACP methyl ester carboxylesterase